MYYTPCIILHVLILLLLLNFIYQVLNLCAICYVSSCIHISTKLYKSQPNSDIKNSLLLFFLSIKMQAFVLACSGQLRLNGFYNTLFLFLCEFSKLLSVKNIQMAFISQYGNHHFRYNSDGSRTLVRPKNI